MSEIVKKPRTLTVQVISNRMDKTVVAAIDRKVPHPKYGKYVKRRTKIFVHDPENSAKIGDVIIVTPSRPLSKKKHWLLVQVMKKEA